MKNNNRTKKLEQIAFYNALIRLKGSISVIVASIIGFGVLSLVLYFSFEERATLWLVIAVLIGLIGFVGILILPKKIKKKEQENQQRYEAILNQNELK